MTAADLTAVGPLEGELVRLLPLTAEHAPALLEAAREHRERYRFTDVPGSPEAMRAYVERALAQRSAQAAVPFAVTARHDGQVLGTTRFCYFEYWRRPADRPHRPAGRPDAAEIGYTWLAHRAQGTGVNRESKRLLLEVAFERWALSRITFRTDARNAYSRRALESLGAHLDGVLRSAQAGYDGTVRDNAVYSILDREWPTVRARLAAPGPSR
ncbi:GNAT family N-acetyltransferase [Kitasatospora sp. NPDC049285]|uniref:GNAT family N-acetyltransferase n=1 Tax=Kitasatospora sp. NPDC049285 TaxID=3157096 RepID=UPI0034457D8D